MDDDLRAVLAGEHDVGLGEGALEVAARVRARRADQALARDRLVGVEERLAHLPLDVDRRDGGDRLRARVGAHGGDRGALVAGFGDQARNVVGADRGVDARQRERRRQVDPPHARVGVRRAQHGCVQHPVQLQVGGVDGLAAGALGAGRPHGGPADDVAGPAGHWSRASSSTTSQTSS